VNRIAATENPVTRVFGSVSLIHIPYGSTLDDGLNRVIADQHPNFLPYRLIAQIRLTL
jgi:hypothetical protein